MAGGEHPNLCDLSNTKHLAPSSVLEGIASIIAELIRQCKQNGVKG